MAAETKGYYNVFMGRQHWQQHHSLTFGINNKLLAYILGSPISRALICAVANVLAQFSFCLEVFFAPMPIMVMFYI